jgi:hypothetical protein
VAAGEALERGVDGDRRAGRVEDADALVERIKRVAMELWRARVSLGRPMVNLVRNL